jgi:hypothetical protein
MADEQPKRDTWDKISLMLSSGGGLFTAVTVAIIGFFTSSYLKEKELADTQSREKMQAYETNVRIYTELMSKREEAESALRKDMFVSIIQSFLRAGDATTDERVLNLELLSYNFHESLNLKPLFIYLERKIQASKDSKAQEYLSRLYHVAGEISRKQMLVLESAGQKADLLVDLGALKTIRGGLPLESAKLTLDSVTRSFQLVLLEANAAKKEMKFRLEIRTGADSTGSPETSTTEFSVGVFDFPMIDNTRLSQDQRCAVVLNAFEGDMADITLAYFPGSYASLKEKPYYSEVVRNLMRTNQMVDQERQQK